MGCSSLTMASSKVSLALRARFGRRRRRVWGLAIRALADCCCEEATEDTEGGAVERHCSLDTMSVDVVEGAEGAIVVYMVVVWRLKFLGG